MNEQDHDTFQASLQITLAQLQEIDQAEDRVERIHRSIGLIRWLLHDLASSSLVNPGECAVLQSIYDQWYCTIYQHQEVRNEQA